MLHHERGKLAVQSVIEYHVAVANLVEYRYEIALTVGRTFGSLHGAYVRYVAVVAYCVVVYVVADVLYEAVVADGYVAQGGVVYARVLNKTLAHLHAFLKRAELYGAVEHHAVEIVGLEVLCNAYGRPVLGPAAVVLEQPYFLFGKLSVVHKVLLMIIRRRCLLYCTGNRCRDISARGAREPSCRVRRGTLRCSVSGVPI